MFTSDQIKAAHSKVKTGADFPAYIKEIKSLGVTGYDTYVADGHVNYHGADGHSVTAPAKYETLTIADTYNGEEFTKELRAHQQGKTDYLTFINMCATTGIEKWAMDITQMTCTYYNKAGDKMLTEQIPQ